MKKDKKHQSIDYQILEAINTRGYGSLFVPTDFLNLGSRQAVDLVLLRIFERPTHSFACTSFSLPIIAPDRVHYEVSAWLTDRA